MVKYVRPRLMSDRPDFVRRYPLDESDKVTMLEVYDMNNEKMVSARGKFNYVVRY